MKVHTSSLVFIYLFNFVSMLQNVNCLDVEITEKIVFFKIDDLAKILRTIIISKQYLQFTELKTS